MGSILSVEQLRGLSSGDTPNTITLPTGQTLDASAGTFTPSSGQIIQVQSYEYAGETSYTSTNWSTTPYQVDITPVFANSKIFVTASFACRKNNTTTSEGLSIKLYRNGVDIALLSHYFLFSNGAIFSHFNGQHTDTSHNSTSQLNYRIYVATYNGGSYILGDTSSIGNITVMEIAG
jgi:hypothetical protein